MGLRGMDKLYARLKRLPEDIQQEVKDIVQDTTLAVERAAIDNIDKVPHKPGGMTYEAAVEIRKNIVSVFDTDYKGFVGRVQVNAGKMAAYIEFGCGLSAAAYVPTLPENWQKIARSFYINGEGRIQATPYFYPAYFSKTRGYRKKMLDAIKKATKG